MYNFYCHVQVLPYCISSTIMHEFLPLCISFTIFISFIDDTIVLKCCFTQSSVLALSGRVSSDWSPETACLVCATALRSHCELEKKPSKREKQNKVLIVLFGSSRSCNAADQNLQYQKKTAAISKIALKTYIDCSTLLSHKFKRMWTSHLML